VGAQLTLQIRVDDISCGLLNSETKDENISEPHIASVINTARLSNLFSATDIEPLHPNNARSVTMRTGPFCELHLDSRLWY
jgi:hypothetical protein